MRKNRMGFIALVLSVFLSGCVSDEERFKKQLLEVDVDLSQSLERLAKHLTDNTFKNDKLLTEYGAVVHQEAPELKSITELLMADGDVQGEMFQSLVSRRDQARSQIGSASKNGRSRVVMLLSEYDSLAGAISNYKYALSDSVNVLADMSKGKLARITPLSADNKGKPGEEFVGNPQYGNWKEDSSGNAFWEWYGKYALFSTLIGGPMRYDSWASGRRYSYHHDVGRNNYRSPAQKSAERSTVNRVKKQYSQTGKAYQSPYAKNLAPKSVSTNSLINRPNKYSSKYASTKKGSTSGQRSSNKSNYNSRSSSSSRSRSSRSGGK